MIFSGFLIVAACVMTFESRDNAAKVVPSTGGYTAPTNHDDSKKAKVKSYLHDTCNFCYFEREVLTFDQSHFKLIRIAKYN